MKVLVPVTSLCPCSKKISDYGAHNQRSHVTVTAHTSEFVWIEEIVDLVEKQASSRALRPAQAPRREVRHRARLRQPEVRRGHGARRRRAAQPRRAHHRLRGRVGELRVDPQPLRLRADRERQTRPSSAPAGPGSCSAKRRPGLRRAARRAWWPRSTRCTPRPAPRPACARCRRAVRAAHGQGRAPPPGAGRPTRAAPTATIRCRSAMARPSRSPTSSRCRPTCSHPKPQHVVLEVGTGSGYQAAVLAEIVSKVYSIEIIESLGRTAAEASGRTRLQEHRNQDRRRLQGLAGAGALRRHRGHRGGAARARRRWSTQLKPGGRMVIPVGGDGRDPVPEAAHQARRRQASSRSACCRCDSCRWCPGK